MTNDQDTVETEFLQSLLNSGQIERLVAYLGSGEALEVRKKAVGLLLQSIGEYQQEFTSELIDQLYHAALIEDSEFVRVKIIKLLIKIDNAAIDTLVEKIESDNTPTPTDSPHPLLFTDWLESGHTELRLLAVAGLGSTESEKVIPKLESACNDKDTQVQIRALSECGRIGDSECTETVIECLDTEKTEVRIAAAKCLIRIGTDEAITNILPLAKKGENQVQQAIIEELGICGSLDVLGVLLWAIESDNDKLKQAAVRSSVELITNTPVSNSHTTRYTVLTQLQQLSDRDSVSRVCRLLDSDNLQIRRNTAWLLGRIITPDTHTNSLIRLIEAIDDEDTKTAKIAVSQLVQFDDPIVIDQLETIIKSHEFDTESLQRADFIRKQITDKSANDHLKEAVQYTEVSNPVEYTQKQGNNDAD